jgi:hypothetical protein
MKKTATMPVPIFDLETRRKKEDMEIRLADERPL